MNDPPDASPPKPDIPRTDESQAHEEIPREELSAVLRKVAYSGPLPPAEQFEKYDHVLPGSAERILKLAENEQGHRHERDRNEWLQKKRGQILGFICSLAILICGTSFAFLGFGKTGGAIITVTIIGLTSLFLYGQKIEKRNGHSE